MGGGTTIWTGSAFDCFSNEIPLRHSQFSHTGTSGSCNNGAIVVRSLFVEGNNYTSQLNVTLTPDIAGKTIICVHDDSRGTNYLFSWTIPTVIG